MLDIPNWLVESTDAPERDPWKVEEGEFVHIPDRVADPISYTVIPPSGYVWTFPAEGGKS